MLVNGINESFKGTQQTLEGNSSAISERWNTLARRRRSKMKETDYDSATPSLAQEMNLARRACWCNKSAKLQQQQPYCAQCCHNSTATTTSDASSYLAATNDVDDDAEEEEETVLIGATFSKNILIINNNKNTNNINNIEPSYVTETTTTKKIKATTPSTTITPTNNTATATTLSKSNLIKRHNITTTTKTTKTPTQTTTATTTTTNTIPTNSIADNKLSSNTYKKYDNNKKSDDVVNNNNDDDDNEVDNDNKNSDIPEIAALLTEMAATTETHKNINRPTSGGGGDTSAADVDGASVGNIKWQQLLRFWLAFVAFCDAITIKSDDPRFQKARQHQQQPPQQRQNNTGATPTSASNASTKNKKSGKFKLLTSKKMIFLFFVCVFFSCLNRIEARPNVSTPSNAVASEDGLVTNVINAGSTARLTAASNPVDGVSSALPITLEKEKPLLTEQISGPARDNDDDNGHDEEEGHAHQRYPLSQVDFDRVKTPFIIGIWILSASIAKIGFHMTPKLHLIFPESCLLIVVGVIIGVVLFFCTEVAVSPLTPNTFFFYMLPPIILDAGYFMPNRLFFDNLGTILLMAVVGTIFNIASIGGSLYACGLSGIFGDPENAPKILDTFLFASLISAVDPVAVLAVFEEIHVNEILYIVVFGESLLNDAVTVVMYHMMEVYNEIGISEIIAQDIASGVGSFFVVAIGGTVIGIIWGFLTGLVTRFTDHVRVIEPIFIFVMAYLAYLNAEIFHMSGILAITFCGITMKNYVESNISIKSHTTVKYALKMLSSSSETIIFMFLGVATVNNNHVWNTAYVLLTIIFCSVFRVIGVIILTAIANRFRLHKLSRVDQFVMSYGGLRGAVAFALVLLVDERVVKQKDMFVTTTIAVIYFTVFVQGITIKPLVKFLNVKRASKRKPTMNERIHERFMDHLMAGIEDIVGKTGNYNVRDKFKRFDNRFIRPLLIRDLKGAEPKIIETYSKLTMRDAMEVMRRNPSTIGQITGTESMSALFRNYTNNCIGGRWEPPTIYTTCPSLTNLDNNISRNLDMHELDYNPSKKDLTDAKIHHLLAEELKPYRRHRRLSYSRHAVDDRDLSTQVNYKMQMNFKRMFKDRQHHKRSKRGANKQQQEGVKQNHVSFHDFQQNGSTKQFSHDYINEVLNESAEETPAKLNEVTVVGANDDWDDGLTFTAKSSPDSDRANNNSLIAHIQNLPGFDASKARIVHHYAPAAATTAETMQGESSPDQLLTPDIAPTAAELILPWRRDRSYQSFVAENPIPEEDRNMSRDSDCERRVATPTAIESQLPWKRHEDENVDGVQQNEFPAWASNKEYLAYNSPSATFLGGINKPKAHKSVIGLFRRESSGSKGGSIGGTMGVIGTDAGEITSARGSDPSLAAALSGMVVPSATTPLSSRLEKRSQSITTPMVTDGHSGQFPITASHRRNVRRGSMLELSGDIIPEETYHHGQSKSLCEPSGDEWDSAAPLTGARPSSSSSSTARIGGLAANSGREPLLPKLTPRAQIRKMGGIGGVGGKNQVTTALLAPTANSDYDDDEDEDFELYDDENIVVTTTATGNNRRSLGASGSGGGSGGGNTTTTIRLTRNNDESII